MRTSRRATWRTSPPIAAPFLPGNSKADQQARIATLLSTLQNLNGPGVGCPASSRVYGQARPPLPHFHGLSESSSYRLLNSSAGEKTDRSLGERCSEMEMCRAQPWRALFEARPGVSDA
ncbi:hypothetical protein LXA43DRAFT_1033324 [Ganoderma leucocontextum]|nr:hypothetical protein LXA43DRAFT_1054098 [Ganoderma leucocontextum]KAI1786597.1 hypothetical protein LXA43DRAFT_1033324 [Ganoderma leucocontextum]